MSSGRKGSYVEPPMKYNPGLEKFIPNLPRKPAADETPQGTNLWAIVVIAIALLIIVLVLYVAT
jgi:hypothetical protein